jgi:hypothetical protein
MNTQAISVSGAVTYWRLSWTDRERLRQTLIDNGLSEHLLPAARHATTVLRNALQQLYGGNGHLIRPLDGGDGWEVVDERKGVTSNDYAHILSARIHGVASRHIEASVTTTADQRSAIVARFDELNNRLHADAVAALLTRYVSGPCHGTSLRPAGGVYWVPEDKLPQWKRLVAAVETAGETPNSNGVYLLRTAADEGMVIAVRDAITHELTTAAAEIGEDAKSSALGEVALQGRVEASKKLSAKLTRYESLLGESLTSVRQSIATAKQAATVAVVRVSAAKQAEAVAKKKKYGDL